MGFVSVVSAGLSFVFRPCDGYMLCVPTYTALYPRHTLLLLTMGVALGPRSTISTTAGLPLFLSLLSR